MYRSAELNEKIYGNIQPILEQQENIQKLIGASSCAVNMIQKSEVLANTLAGNERVVQAFTESNRAIQAFANSGLNLQNLQTYAMVHPVDELAMQSVMRFHQFELPILKITGAWNDTGIANIAAGLNYLTTSPAIQEIQLAASNVQTWLQTIDFSPLISILERVQNFGFDFDYRKVDEAFLKVMFDARWFPYAGWLAEYSMADQVLDILSTSKTSKSRTKKIDKLIFTYYNKEELDNIKRGWRQMGLPSYMIRILVQSVQAYKRKEYALTVSALSTLWEGIIQEKTNDKEYRISKRTRENLEKLIRENGFEEIFSSFCTEFIFYKCVNPSEVKPDVPGRHSIAHCWYNTYPNRKMALNAILFTDFLLQLIPLDQIA